MSVLPACPRFVVTIITPFAPRVPYMAVAEASFKISIDSISEGFILSSGLSDGPVTAPTLVPGTIKTPSITYRGSLLPFMEFVPLILIEEGAPGCPELILTTTPAAFP